MKLDDKSCKKKERRRANNLDGRKWLINSISIWSDIKKSTEEIQLGHPAMFPVELVDRLLESYTTEEERIVLDPFAGTGATLVAAYYRGKTGIGVEINPEFAELVHSRFKQQLLFAPDNGTYQIHNADVRDLLKYVEPESVDICITSPPYWDILNQKRTADNKPIRNYGNLEGDLGTISDYREFINSLAEIFSLVYKVLKPQKYCIVNVMDLRKKSTFYPFHMDVANFMTEIGFKFDDIIIWDRRQEYNNLRPLGYPSVFRINRVNEYLLIFQK